MNILSDVFLAVAVIATATSLSGGVEAKNLRAVQPKEKVGRNLLNGCDPNVSPCLACCPFDDMMCKTSNPTLPDCVGGAPSLPSGACCDADDYMCKQVNPTYPDCMSAPSALTCCDDIDIICRRDNPNLPPCSSNPASGGADCCEEGD